MFIRTMEQNIPSSISSGLRYTSGAKRSLFRVIPAFKVCKHACANATLLLFRAPRAAESYPLIHTYIPPCCFSASCSWPLFTNAKLQVGATTGVALLEGTGGVNGTVLGKTVFGWIITIVVCAISCSVLFAQGAYAPYVYDTIDLPDSTSSA